MPRSFLHRLMVVQLLILLFPLSGCGSKQPDLLPLLYLTIAFIGVFGLSGFFAFLLFQAENVASMRKANRETQARLDTVQEKMTTLTQQNMELATRLAELQGQVLSLPTEVRQSMFEQIDSVPQATVKLLAERSGSAGESQST